VKRPATWRDATAFDKHSEESFSTSSMTAELLQQDDLSRAVLLLLRASAADRRSLLRLLDSAGIRCQLIGLLPEFSPSDMADQRDVMEFIHGFNERMQRVTQKERLVLQSILAGQTNKAISQHLELTVRAVELRKASLMRKLDVTSHTELIRLTTKYETLKRYLLRQPSPTPAGHSEVCGDSQSRLRIDAAHSGNIAVSSPEATEARRFETAAGLANCDRHSR
jgi:DNA-binding CsgD family transcriptional regulator